VYDTRSILLDLLSVNYAYVSFYHVGPHYNKDLLTFCMWPALLI